MNAHDDGTTAKGSIELHTLLLDASQAGAFFADSRDREALLEAGHQLQFVTVGIDLKHCNDHAAVQARIAEALQFPDWFGANLDALADCLNDLSWLPSTEGWLLLFEHASDWREHDGDGMAEVLEILNDASARWAEDRVPFWAFVLVPARELEAMEG